MPTIYFDKDNVDAVYGSRILERYFTNSSHREATSVPIRLRPVGKMDGPCQQDTYHMGVYLLGLDWDDEKYEIIAKDCKYLEAIRCAPSPFLEEFEALYHDIEGFSICGCIETEFYGREMPTFHWITKVMEWATDRRSGKKNPPYVPFSHAIYVGLASEKICDGKINRNWYGGDDVAQDRLITAGQAILNQRRMKEPQNVAIGRRAGRDPLGRSASVGAS